MRIKQQQLEHEDAKQKKGWAGSWAEVGYRYEYVIDDVALTRVTRA
jgi:hypothetical protein